jgi:hypothetical protein
MLQGYTMNRLRDDGDEAYAIYDLQVTTPVAYVSLPVAEWSVVRDGGLVSQRIIFDTAVRSFCRFCANSTAPTPTKTYTW